MKKVLFFVFAVVTAITFASCKQTCSCVEENSGYTDEINLEESDYTCSEYEDLLNELSEDLNQDWNCK